MSCYQAKERAEPVCASYARDGSYTDCVWGCALWDFQAEQRAKRAQPFPPCFFCGRTDIAPDEECPWGCLLRHGPIPNGEVP